ncbi:Fe-S oxidoreductase [Paramagnetospirillum caucaseum]|uniref:Fe-S oxidoreductase n=1 Tax=Paramagnetospirillum caucaseum TaxID=1244869 RepID=M2YC16_9PROT|nr:radical SAM protein [Paramagnetospirillum caucaseum]EME70546.1 Fe-S oxidoreductase [Paramagnetospirillum caucaseum]
MATLYSALKFLGFPDQLTALREGRVAAPVHIRIKPINHCNHHCWYCAYRTDDLKLGEDMDENDQIPAAKMMEIVDDIVAMGVRAVTFSGGGEPLLYKTLPEVIERLAAGGVKVATLTNGSNLKGRVAEAFARHGTWVRVSVDAWDDESYVASRGAKDGEFTRLMANMRNFVATGTKCVLGVSFIIGKNNYRRVAEVVEMFREVGVNHVKLSAAVVANDVTANNAYHRELMEVVTSQIDQAMALQTDTFRVLNHFHETEERFEKSYTTCPFLQFLTVIGADLSVYTCQDKAYTAEGTLGSIRDRSFRDYWFSEENRQKLFAFDPSQMCRHHCVTHTKNLALHEVLSIDPDHGVFV